MSGRKKREALARLEEARADHPDLMYRDNGRSVRIWVHVPYQRTEILDFWPTTGTIRKDGKTLEQKGVEAALDALGVG